MTPSSYQPTIRSHYKRSIYLDITFKTYAEAYEHAKNARSVIKTIPGLRDYTEIVIIVGN